MQREQPEDGVKNGNSYTSDHTCNPQMLLPYYNVLGYGFLEAVYKRALAIELRTRDSR